TLTNYGYDNAGNRTQNGSQTFTYNARNQLATGPGATYTYTPRGTLTAVITSSSTTPSTSDAFGQTITQAGQPYAYDAPAPATPRPSGTTPRPLPYPGLGNTIAADGTATYTHDPHGALVAVKTGVTGVLAWTDQHTDVVGQYTPTSTTLTGSTSYSPLGK